MKPLVLFAFTLVVSAPSYAFDSGTHPPQRPLWEKLLSTRFDVSERTQVIQLAVLLPKIYGFHFICQFRSAAKGTAPIAVLPGEWLEAADGGSLHCPDRYDVELGKQTKLRVMQNGFTPRFVLSEGRMTLTAHQDSFFLETPAYSIAAAGQGKEQVLTAVSEPKLQSLACDRGALSMSFELHETPGEQVLSSRDCRMELAIDGGPAKRYLTATDRVNANNLTVPRRYWGSDPAPGRGTNQAGELTGLQLSYIPAPNPEAPMQIHWIAQRSDPPFLPDLNCIVFGRKGEMESATEISKFASSTLSGSFTVDPAYKQGFVSMVCENDTVTLSSNVQDMSMQTNP